MVWMSDYYSFSFLYSFLENWTFSIAIVILFMGHTEKSKFQPVTVITKNLVLLKTTESLRNIQQSTNVVSCCTKNQSDCHIYSHI
jgi:hypothetical protein